MKSLGRLAPLYLVVFSGLAAISITLPLPVMGALALLGSVLLARPAAREAAEPLPEA